MKRVFILAATITAAISCTTDISEIVPSLNSSKKEISITLNSAQVDTQSRVDINEDTESSTLAISWATDDRLGAWSPSASSFELFKIIENSLSDDCESATFSGEILEADDSYRLIHPYVEGATILNSIYNLNLSEQTIDMSQEDEFDSLEKSLYMVSPIFGTDITTESTMQHVGSIICLNLRFANTPTNLKIQSVEIASDGNILLYNAADLDLSASVEDANFLTNYVQGSLKSTIENSPTITSYDETSEEYALKFAALPFTFGVDEELTITITTTSGSGTYVNTVIAQNSNSTPIELARATHLTINRVCDIKDADISYSDTWVNFAATSFSGGSGSEEDPYIINTAEELALLTVETQAGYDSVYRTAHFKLESDIDLSAHQWSAICSYGFSGSLDGNNKCISGLYIYNTYTSSSSYYQGLFSILSGASLKDLTVKGKVISASNYVGGIVGLLNNGGTIDNCTSYVDVTGVKQVGGIAGTVYYNSYVGISSCTNYGTITASGNYCGGITGYVVEGKISNSTNSGDITNTKDGVGGIVGYSKGTNIHNCCNFASSISSSYISSSSNSNVGGVIGYLYNGTVTNCYSRAESLNGNSGSGGLIGYISSYAGKITNCYSIVNTITASRNVGGLIGYSNTSTEGLIHGCYTAVKNISSVDYSGSVSGMAYAKILSSCYYDNSCNLTTPTGQSSDTYTDDNVKALSTAEMQSSVLVGYLNAAAAEYNATNPSIMACGWVAVDSDYPTLDYSTTPTLE